MAPGSMEACAVEELSHVLCGLQLLQEQRCSAESMGWLPCGLGGDLQLSGDPANQKKERGIRGGRWLAFITACVAENLGQICPKFNPLGQVVKAPLETGHTPS